MLGPMIKGFLITAFLLVCAVALPAQERGTVVAIHTASQNRYIPGYAGGDGIVANPGVTVKDINQVYRVETDKKFYELEGGHKICMATGDAIVFRIEKDKAYVRLGGKEQKFRLVGEELKSK